MIDLHRQIIAKVGELRQYAPSDAMVHVRGLLDLLEASYKEQLADVAAADLAKVQGALKQVMCLRDAIFGVEGSVPRL